MNTKAAKRNVLCSMLYEAITIIYGLVIPRIVLAAFGSELNGLVASIQQFVNYITLLEGGLSGVIMAALYRPLAEKDNARVSAIIKATDRFFKTLGMVFIGYTVCLAVVYPLVVKTSFSWAYVFALVLIISASLFIQYFFALSYRLLLNADQKGYIVYITLIAFSLINFIITLAVVYLCPQIHILKLLSTAAFMIQPVVFRRYVKKHYRLDSSIEADPVALSQRWDGFAQNIAFLIHSNTDVVVLTFFSTLEKVSVYSVYMLIISAMKTVVSSVTTALVPSLGSVLATSSDEEKNSFFDTYEICISFITTFVFSCGAVLITPFVMVYTKGITDVSYNEPIFGYIMVLAEAVYCFRDPYVSVAYASGHFRQTAKYAYSEAILNILVSIVLVRSFGLIGVAIGTLVSMLLRMLLHMHYLSGHILKRSLWKSLRCLVVYFAAGILCALIVDTVMKTAVDTYFAWFYTACIVATIAILVIGVVSMLFYRRQFIQLIQRINCHRNGK